MYVFLRTLGDDRILVALNGSDKPKTFAMPIGDRSWRSLQLDDLIGGGVTKPAGSDAAIEWRRLARGSCGFDEVGNGPRSIWGLTNRAAGTVSCIFLPG